MADPAAVDPSAPHVVLLGMMGSGKSSVGRALADRTGWPFIDNDVLVERATGRTARELLAERGEDAMRAAESAALREGLAMPAPVITATAAGTILDPDDRAAIDDGGLVVWLHAPPEVLAERATGATHRPWLDDDPVAWFRQVDEERAPLYRGIADVAIDTSRTAPEEAANVILDRLRAAPDVEAGRVPSADA